MRSHAYDAPIHSLCSATGSVPTLVLLGVYIEFMSIVYALTMRRQLAPREAKQQCKEEGSMDS